MGVVYVFGMGWFCTVDKERPDEEESGRMAYVAYDASGNCVREGTDLRDLFSELPPYSTVVFRKWDKDYNYELDDIEISSHHMLLQGVGGPVVSFRRLALPESSMIRGLVLKDGKVECGGNVIFQDCHFFRCSMDEVNLWRSTLLNSSIERIVGSPEHPVDVVACTLNECRIGLASLVMCRTSGCTVVEGIL